MRTFEELRRDPRAMKFLDSPLGTLYVLSDDVGNPELMIRYFDALLTPSYVTPFADLIRDAEEWITQNPELAGLVRIEQPVEVGTDFVARPYHVYYTSTRTYTGWDNPPEPPPELAEMRLIAGEALSSLTNGRQGILRQVLTRSLLE